MKDELGKKNTTKFVGLRARTYSYLIDDCSEEKKEAKGTEERAIKRRLKLKIITVWKQLNLRIKELSRKK